MWLKPHKNNCYFFSCSLVRSPLIHCNYKTFQIHSCILIYSTYYQSISVLTLSQFLLHSRYFGILSLSLFFFIIALYPKCWEKVMVKRALSSLSCCAFVGLSSTSPTKQFLDPLNLLLPQTQLPLDYFLCFFLYKGNSSPLRLNHQICSHLKKSEKPIFSMVSLSRKIS